MGKLALLLAVVMMALAGCQSLPPQPTAPVAAVPTLASTPGPEMKPTLAAAPSAAAPALAVMPGPDVKPAMDKNFKDPVEAWCQGGSYDFGDFSCQDGEYHLVAKGPGNIATTYGGNFKDFILRAQMRLSSANAAYLGVDFAMLTPEVAASEHITGTQGALCRYCAWK